MLRTKIRTKHSLVVLYEGCWSTSRAILILTIISLLSSIFCEWCLPGNRRQKKVSSGSLQWQATAYFWRVRLGSNDEPERSNFSASCWIGTSSRLVEQQVQRLFFKPVERVSGQLSGLFFGIVSSAVFFFLELSAQRSAAANSICPVRSASKHRWKIVGLAVWFLCASS
jgi:hypothetical protein